MTSVDFQPSSRAGVSSLVLSSPEQHKHWPDEVKRIRKECVELGFGGVDAVVHAAGSWAGGDVRSDEFANSLEHLW